MKSKSRKPRIPSSTAATPTAVAAVRPTLKLAVQYATAAIPDSTLPARIQLRKWAKTALQQDVQVTIRIVDEPEGCDLNHRFRGKNHATNVLTFTYDDMQPLCGDIVLCAPVIAYEACQQGKPLPDHYAHLVIHGMLHLQGYDHEQPSDASVMEQLETTLMQALGYDDPYGENPCQALVTSGQIAG